MVYQENGFLLRSSTQEYYVEKVLKYYRDLDRFAKFSNDDLKDYIRFKGALVDFRRFYHLEQFNLKEIDKYIWQLGNTYFPKDFSKKNNGGALWLLIQA